MEAGLNVGQTHQEPQWEDPHFFDEINTPRIPASLLPSWAGVMAQALSRATQTPAALSVMLLLSVIATCMQKKFKISPYGDGYQETLSIWTATVLPPASRKTSVFSALTAPLSDWEAEQGRAMADSMRRSKAKREVGLARIAKLTKAASNKANADEREMLLHEITELERELPEEVVAPRLFTGDATPERLQSLMAEQGEKMAALSDEGGIFDVMAGLYSNGKANIDVFLQGHAGSPVKVDRASRTVLLENPALTFGLAIQPIVLCDLAKGDKSSFRGRGALARFLFCLPENNIGRRDVRRNEPILENVTAEYHAGVKGLLALPGAKETRVLTLDANALECWLVFAEYVEHRQGTGGEFEPIQDWTGKLPGAVLRIAGLLHLVEHGDLSLVVNRSTMGNAVDLASLLIEHAKAAFGMMGVDRGTDDAMAVLKWIEDNNVAEFSKTDCRKALKGRWTTVGRLETAIAELQGRDIISAVKKKKTGGRHAAVYTTNPKVHAAGL